MNEITYLDRIDWCHFGYHNISLEEIFQIIRTGELVLTDMANDTFTLRQITEAIRQQPDYNLKNAMKSAYCPAITVNGTWDGLRINNYSQYTALDFDNIKSAQDMDFKMATLRFKPYAVALFRTFKPHRFKAIVKHNNNDPAQHKDMYEQIMMDCGADDLDASCKDLSRRTYLVWDKDIWVNPDPVPYDYVPSPQIPVMPVVVRPVSSGKQKSPKSIICILNSSWHKNHPEYWKVGNRAISIFQCACCLCEYGVPGDMMLDYFLNGGWVADDFSENEVIKQVKGAYEYKLKRKEYDIKEFI